MRTYLMTLAAFVLAYCFVGCSIWDTYVDLGESNHKVSQNWKHETIDGKKAISAYGRGVKVCLISEPTTTDLGFNVSMRVRSINAIPVWIRPIKSSGRPHTAQSFVPFMTLNEMGPDAYWNFMVPASNGKIPSQIELLGLLDYGDMVEVDWTVNGVICTYYFYMDKSGTPQVNTVPSEGGSEQYESSQQPPSTPSTTPVAPATALDEPELIEE